MKIAIIGQTLNKNHKDKISGGIQTVERLHVKILVSQGHEVFFICPNDSEAFNDSQLFHLCRCEGYSQEYHSSTSELSKAQKSAINKSLTSEIKGWIAEIHPDAIINHSFSSSHVRISAEFAKDIPTMCFIHNTPDTAMDIGIIAKVQFYKKLTENGGALVCVSGYQRDLWRKALRQRLANGDSFDFLEESDIDKIYDKICYPVYVERQDYIKPNSDHFIVITRPDPIKNLHKLLELLANSKPLKLHIYLAHPGDLQEVEYYRTKIHPAIKELERKYFIVQLNHNAPRSQLLEDLSTAKGCFIPCPVEAAPVVLLEAGSMGVKSIVFAKKKHNIIDHAANDLLGSDNIDLIDVSSPFVESSENLRKVIENFEVTQTDRQKLADFTSNKHGFSNRIEDLITILDSIVKNKQPKKVLWI